MRFHLGPWRLPIESRCCALVLGMLAIATSSFAQTPDAGKKQSQRTDNAKKGVAAAPSAADTPAATPQLEPTIWPEPNRKDLLQNEFKELSGQLLSERDRGLVLEMAQGRGQLERSLIKRYVDSYTSELTKRPNIAALMKAEGSDPRRVRALDEATNRLVQPLLEPASGANSAFRREYVSQLVAKAKDLLQGHLYTRTFFMVVLSRANAPELVPLFIEVLNDPDQTQTAKLLASVGLILLCQNSPRPLDANTEAIPAAQAIVDFLEKNPDLPWPMQCRHLEAIGSLRQATASPLEGKAELADVAFELLTDDAVDPQVRSWAGWALTRLIYPSQVSGLNYELIAYELGRAAVAAGERVLAVSIPKTQPTKYLILVAKLSEPLVRILDSFAGDPSMRLSGLSRIAPGSSTLRSIEGRVRALASASAQFSQAVGIQVGEQQKAVKAALDELKSYLAANPPKKDTFYNDGPKAAWARSREALSEGSDASR